MVSATLDLLRAGGLSSAGIHPVIAASKAPIGSLYHYFPGGKHELVAAALAEAEQAVGESFAAVFAGAAPIDEKVRVLFAVTGDHLKDSKYSRGCPVGAVTLDLNEDSEPLRGVCRKVFGSWVDEIAAGLHEVPKDERRPVAQWILATLEGALILARADGNLGSLRRTGDWVADALAERFAPRSRRLRARAGEA